MYIVERKGFKKSKVFRKKKYCFLSHLIETKNCDSVGKRIVTSYVKKTLPEGRNCGTKLFGKRPTTEFTNFANRDVYTRLLIELDC